MKIKESHLRILMVTAPIIFVLVYFIASRIQIRILQLAANDIDVQMDDRSWIYATIVTIVYSLIFFFVAKDLDKS